MFSFPQKLQPTRWEECPSLSGRYAAIRMLWLLLLRLQVPSETPHRWSQSQHGARTPNWSHMCCTTCLCTFWPTIIHGCMSTITVSDESRSLVCVCDVLKIPTAEGHSKQQREDSWSMWESFGFLDTFTVTLWGSV